MIMTAALMLLFISAFVVIGMGAVGVDFRRIFRSAAANMGKIWMAGAVVAVLMVIAGIGFGIIEGCRLATQCAIPASLGEVMPIPPSTVVLGNPIRKSIRQGTATFHHI